MDLEGAVVVVTGASSGIGWATGWAFAGEGATVVLAARREERLHRLAGEIGRHGRVASVVPCDVSRWDDVMAMAEQVEREHGRCDVLVNNAGIPGGGPFADLTIAQIEEVVGTNYLGVLYGTKAFLPMMLAAGKGHVVNLSSMAGRYAVPGSSVYSSTKHAVVAFSEALNYELAPRGVLVTSVNPGLVATERFPHRDAKRKLLRVMQPVEVAEAIVDVVRRGIAPERSIPRWLAAGQAVRVLAPPLYRFGLGRAVRRGLRATRIDESGEEPGPDAGTE